MSRPTQGAGAGDAPVEQARADAAARANVTASQVQVVQVEAREWGDAGLGCPEPGRLYAQVITPGFLILLEAAGQRFEYHADRRGRVVLCVGGRPA